MCHTPVDPEDEDMPPVVINKEGSGPTLYLDEQCVRSILAEARDLGMNV